MLCLGGRDRATYSGIIRLLDVLLSSDIAETEKRYILESDYNIPMTEAIESEMSMTCNLSEGVWERGMTEGVVTSIKNIMETLDLTLDQAMAALKVPDEEREKYADLVKHSA